MNFLKTLGQVVASILALAVLGCLALVALGCSFSTAPCSLI